MTSRQKRHAKALLKNSTNGRFLAAKLATIRSGLALASELAPDRAAAWAERLFRTPLRYPQPESEKLTLAGGRPYLLRGKLASGRRVKVMTWTFGEGPLVLLTHGWAGRGGQLQAMIAPLVASGFSVLVYDAPGHGLSAGKTASVVDFAQTVIELDRQLGPVHAIIGHSLGGSAALLATELGLSPRAVVTIGSPTAPASYADRFQEVTGLGEEIMAKVVARLEERYGVTLAELDLAQKPQLAAGVPTLVIHDRTDGDVPVGEAGRLAAALDAPEVLVTEGLGHRRVLRDRVVIDRIVGFLATTRGLLLAGAGERHTKRDLFTGRILVA